MDYTEFEKQTDVLQKAKEIDEQNILHPKRGDTKITGGVPDYIDKEYEAQYESFLLNEAFKYNPDSKSKILMMGLELFKLWEEKCGFEVAKQIMRQQAVGITVELSKYIKEKENGLHRI